MYTRQDLEKYVGKRIQFRVTGNPKVYRGMLTECNAEYFAMDINISVPLTCAYESIAKGSIMPLARV